MDAVSLPLYHLARSSWQRLATALALLWLLVLLGLAVGAPGTDPTSPGDGVLVGPFRWEQIRPLEG